MSATRRNLQGAIAPAC